MPSTRQPSTRTSTRDDVDRLLTRVSTSIDERTEGKYADKVTKVREQLDRGVERLAERRHY